MVSFARRIQQRSLDEAIARGRELARATENLDAALYHEAATLWSGARVCALAALMEQSVPEAHNLDSAVRAILGTLGGEAPFDTQTQHWMGKQVESSHAYAPESGLPSLGRLRICCLDLLAASRPLSHHELDVRSALESRELAIFIPPPTLEVHGASTRQPARI